MNESKKRFVDQLLAADAPSADARQLHEKELRSMFEQTLTRHEHVGFFSADGPGPPGRRRGLLAGLPFRLALRPAKIA